MKITYLSKSTLSVFLILGLLFFVSGSVVLFIINFLVLSLLILLFRKRFIKIQENQLTTTGIIYSPINGKVIEVSKSDRHCEILIKSDFYHEYGIYLPISSQIENLKFNKMKKVFRYFTDTSGLEESGLSLEVKDKRDNLIKIQFHKFYTGSSPELVIMPGDRGVRQANIGYFPYGGLVKVSYGNSFNSEVQVGDKVVGAETILAREVREEKQ